MRNGRYELCCRPLAEPGKDCGNVAVSEITGDPFEAGDLRGTGHTAYFVSSPSLPLPTYHGDWNVAGEALTFSDYAGEPGLYLVIEPWRKIG